MTIKHIGLNAHRLLREPLEQAFADEWEAKAPTTLGYLLYGQDKHKHAVTQREAEVAATIIQWLGSHVGSCFVDEVRAKAGKR